MTAIKAALDWPALAADYARYHAHPLNRLCHAVGIPLIMLAVVRWTQWPEISLVPAAAVVLPLYAAWNPPLALGMAALLWAMAALAPHLSPWTVWAAFIMGWVFQFVGHSLYEGRSPAFTRNLLHVLVGPLWVLGEYIGEYIKDSPSDPAPNML